MIPVHFRVIVFFLIVPIYGMDEIKTGIKRSQEEELLARKKPSVEDQGQLATVDCLRKMKHCMDLLPKTAQMLIASYLWDDIHNLKLLFSEYISSRCYQVPLFSYPYKIVLKGNLLLHEMQVDAQKSIYRLYDLEQLPDWKVVQEFRYLTADCLTMTRNGSFVAAVINKPGALVRINIATQQRTMVPIFGEYKKIELSENGRYALSLVKIGEHTAAFYCDIDAGVIIRLDDIHRNTAIHHTHSDIKLSSDGKIAWVSTLRLDDDNPASFDCYMLRFDESNQATLLNRTQCRLHSLDVGILPPGGYFSDGFLIKAKNEHMALSLMSNRGASKESTIDAWDLHLVKAQKCASLQIPHDEKIETVTLNGYANNVLIETTGHEKRVRLWDVGLPLSFSDLSLLIMLTRANDNTLSSAVSSFYYDEFSLIKNQEFGKLVLKLVETKSYMLSHDVTEYAKNMMHKVEEVLPAVCGGALVAGTLLVVVGGAVLVAYLQDEMMKNWSDEAKAAYWKRQYENLRQKDKIW